MINVYALDPELLTNWSDFRYFISCFGYDKGRLIARYPNKWKKRIYDSVQGSPVEKKRIEIALQRIDDRIVRQKNREFDGDSNWLENAIKENAVRPFQAIVSRQATEKSVANLIHADNIEDTTDYDTLPADDARQFWKAPISKVVERDAATMAKEVADLVKAGETIRFVDGYFGPDALQYFEPFKAFMGLFDNRDLTSLQVEFHCRCITDEIYFRGKCTDWVAPSIPAGLQVKFYRWQEDQMHNRFVLTEKGGVAFLEGLAGYRGTGRKTDVIALLHRDTVDTLNREFTADTTEMTLVDVIEIDGKMQ